MLAKEAAPPLKDRSTEKASYKNTAAQNSSDPRKILSFQYLGAIKEEWNSTR